mgnify:CR=1 FL=1
MLTSLPSHSALLEHFRAFQHVHMRDLFQDDERFTKLSLQVPHIFIDYSKNIEGTTEVEQGLKDPIWINFMKKGENGDNFVTMLRSYA